MQESEMREWNVFRYDPALGEVFYSDLEEVDGMEMDWGRLVKPGPPKGHTKVWEPLLWSSIHIKVTGVTRGEEIWK